MRKNLKLTLRMACTRPPLDGLFESRLVDSRTENGWITGHVDSKEGFASLMREIEELGFSYSIRSSQAFLEESPMYTKHLPQISCFGYPFMFDFSSIYECSHCPGRCKSPKTEMAAEAMTCAANMHVKGIRYFPDFKIPLNMNKKSRTLLFSNLKTALASTGPPHTATRFYFSATSEDSHVHQHPDHPALSLKEPILRGLPCNLCGKTYKSRKNLIEHQRNVHKITPELNGKIRCTTGDSCPFRCNSYATLRNHLRHDHDVEMRSIERSFTSLDDFKTWKDAEEKRSRACFIKQTGVKRLSNNVDKYYYVCHRTGTYRAQGRGARTLKSQGSVKLDHNCPATMEVEHDPINDSLVVKYFVTHLGHQTDEAALGLLTLTDLDRRSIADKLKNGVPVERILEDARGNGSELNRLHLVSRKDITNIKRSLTPRLSGLDRNALLCDKLSSLAGVVSSSTLSEKLLDALLENVSEMNAKVLVETSGELDKTSDDSEQLILNIHTDFDHIY